VEGNGTQSPVRHRQNNEGKGTVGALINDRTMYQQATAALPAFQENMEAMKHNFLLRGFFQETRYEDAAELGETPDRRTAFGSVSGKFCS